MEFIIIILMIMITVGLYACLVVGKQADEIMEEFMSAADSPDAGSGEVKQ